MVRRCGPRLTAAQKPTGGIRILNAIGRALGHSQDGALHRGAGGIPPVPRRHPDRAGGHL